LRSNKELTQSFLTEELLLTLLRHNQNQCTKASFRRATYSFTSHRACGRVRSNNLTYRYLTNTH